MHTTPVTSVSLQVALGINIVKLPSGPNVGPRLGAATLGPPTGRPQHRSCLLCGPVTWPPACCAISAVSLGESVTTGPGGTAQWVAGPPNLPNEETSGARLHDPPTAQGAQAAGNGHTCTQKGPTAPLGHPS